MNLKIFLRRINDIVVYEGRPCSFRDLLKFEHDGKIYEYSYGTVRNKFSELSKKGMIERAFKSSTAFYTIPGVKFNKSMTGHHTGVSSNNYSLTYKQNEILHLLLTVPMDGLGIHDIRLKFKAKGLWSILPLYSESEYFIQDLDIKSNGDITLYDIVEENFRIKVVIHKTDTVSIMIACSQVPISIDIVGLSRLTAGLVRVEERLQQVINEYIRLNLRNNKLSSSLPVSRNSVPHHTSWIVTMWHFGSDSLTEYSGARFHITWGEALNVFRAYSKKFANKKKFE
jgi:hypothetical protein